jgi:3-methyladenine DNA glycosylase AlkC
MGTENTLIRELINQSAVLHLAEKIKGVYPPFEKEQFVAQIMATLPSMSIGDRSKLIKENLRQFLPNDFSDAVQILVNALPSSLGTEASEVSGGFIIWPLTMYVSDYGQSHFDLSMQALYEMTKRFTSEFGIRALLDKYPEESYKYLEQWAKDPNCHVRRLVSEGTRPRLPWAGRLKYFGKDKQRLLDLLKPLSCDSTELVRRSVANHLNDIAKENPDLVVNTLSGWKKEMPHLSDKHIKHALRTLVKEGHKGALELLGFSHGVLPQSHSFRVKSDKIKLGGYLELQADILFEDDDSEHVVDYVVYFLKANGSHSPKVFKWKNIRNESQLKLQKRHLVKQFTTRTHYTGQHFVALQVNGTEIAKQEFWLEM